MELDELKARWQQESEKNIDINNQSMEQLETILRQKTSSTLGHIKEKYKGIISYLMVGLLLNIIVSPFLHFLLGDEGPVFRLTFNGLFALVTFLTLGLIVVFFYWLKYSAFNTEVADTDVRTTLEQKIRALRRSLRHELTLIIGIFISIFIIGRASSQYLGNGSFSDIFRKDILLSLGAGVLILIFYIVKRVKAYNSYIRKLEEYLAEFEDKGSF
ncbi:hypothetical protein [Desertivirga arenae]|uniref:hypothetical protein n=1 Tax=Desertivirga arenae TaxID=2810309 RepID=UPI001A95B547|nr:hypothetical protein [Pedobacter sp. SYSU D00823]